MSKKFLGIFAVIILSVIPFCSFAQEGVLTQKQEGNTNNIYYTIGGANTSSGIDCFDYYRFGRKNWISILVNSKNQKYKAGDTIKFVGQISNESNLPMLKLGIYAQLYRVNNSLSAHKHGDYLVDEFFALENISMNASTTKTVEFEYKIPNGLTSGRYVLGTSIVEDRKFNMSGVPFLEGSYQGRTFFEIDNKENNECFFEREKVYINDILYKQKDVTPDFQLDKTKEYTIKYSLKNSSENEQIVSIKKTLYKWDNYSEANKIDQKIDEISIRGDAYTLFEDKMPELKGGVYLYEVIAQNDNFKSILKVRWVIHDSSAPGRINFSGLSKFPLKEGDNAFIFNCFQSVSDYFRYSGKIVSILKDKKGFELAKTEYQSDDITSNIMAQKMDFQAVQDYNDLILETIFYDKDGNIIDKSVLNYDCSIFSSVLEKLKLEVKNGELIIKPYDVCGNQAESKLSIEVKDSEKKPFYVESIPPTKELRKKLDFADGETYQIFAMANMKVAAKMQYTHHAIKNNNMIAYIVLGILAILFFMFITKKMKKNNSQVSMFILLGLFLFPFMTYAAAPSMPAVTGPGNPVKSIPATGSWNAVSGATNYKWEIRSNSCSGILLAQGETSDTSITIDGNMNVWNEATKYLCVKACNSDGCSSIGSKGFTVQINPTIQSPLNGGNIDGWDKKLDWSDVNGVFGYKYQICFDSNCSTVLASGDVSASEIIIKDININNWNQNNYYWRVKSCAGPNYTNCMNNFTNYSYFVNKIFPNYQAPDNGSVISSTPLIIDWTTTTGSNNYQYEICRNNRCTDATKVWTGKVLESKTNLYFNVPIWDGVTYYWRMKSCYDSEQKKCSGWGTLDVNNNYRSFKTNLSPEIISPENKKDISINDKFSWEKMDGMDKYEIKFYSSLPYDSNKACIDNSCSGSGTVEIYSTSTAETSINADQLIYYIKSNPNNPIYWRIRACDSTKCTSWSYRTFAQGYYYPHIFYINNILNIKTPNDGSNLSPSDALNNKLSWDTVSNSDKYEIKFYSSLPYDSNKACIDNSCSGSGTVEIYSTSTAETSINADQLIYYIKSNPNNPIYWRIRACRSAACTLWSYRTFAQGYYYPHIFYIRSQIQNISPFDQSVVTPYLNNKLSWDTVSNSDKYEIKFYSSLLYDSNKACINNSCFEAVEIYSTSTNSNFIILSRANIWSHSSIYYIIRACRSSACTPWSYRTFVGGFFYPYNIKISSPYPKINSLPSPPNGIDILSPPIIFDWEPVAGSFGYQYYIKNNKTGERKEYTTTSYSIIIPFEDNVDSKDWFHQSDDRGYEWGARFCTSGNLNDCGNANSSPWTTASNFSVQRNLIKDSIKVDTQTGKKAQSIPNYYSRIINPINNRESNDVFLNANLTGIFTSNPQLVDFDTEQEAAGNDFTIPVGEKLRLKLDKLDIENSVSWVVRGGAIDDPPAYWVDDAKKIYDNLTPLPEEYLYESTVNLGSLGTYHPKIGMAVSDPSKDWSKVEVKAFNASDCNNGDCSQAGESDTVKIEKDDNGYYITGQQEGIVYLQVKINDLDTVQTIDNKWFEMGKTNSEMATFVITVDGQVPLAEAGDDKTTFSENFVSLDGSVLYQDSLQPSEQIVKLMVPNPKFDPSKPVSPTNQPEIEKDYKQITNYFYQYEWSCEKGSVENQNSLSATFKAPKIEEDTDVKCFLKMKVYKIIDMISVEDGSLAPEYPKPPELVQESTDSMIVKVLYNQKPVISDLSYDKPDSCNSGATVSIRLTWKYTDNDPAQKAYQIKILEPELDTGKIISESTSYLATGLEYGKTYTWELIAWDQNDVESNKESGTFTTPTHRYPSVDFSFLKIEDPENKDIIKYKFTSNVTTYDDPPKAVLKWNFGDGAESAEKDPEHTYSAAGDYIVKLEATDGDGNMCLMEKDLQAQSEEYIYSENPDIEMFNR